MQLIFVELPKFQKTLEQLNSLTDKWIYFLKETANLDEIPKSLGEVEEIETALNIANEVNMTAEELEIVENRGIALQDERGRIDYAEQKGEQKGESRLIMRLLKKRFGDIPAAISSQVEDLSVENLESLGEDFLDFNSLEDLENWLEERSRNGFHRPSLN